METELKRRLAEMSGPADSANWDGVQSRAKALRSHPRSRWFQRRSILTGACLLLVVLVAAPALAVRSDIFGFSGADRAPTVVQRDFASLNVGAPPGMAPGVISGETRQVLTLESKDGEHSLWVAPTRGGGYCRIVDRLGGGCDRDRKLPVSVGMGKLRKDTPVLIAGAVLLRDASAVEVAYEDGTQEQVEFVWVSSPINAGFFLAEVPLVHEAKGKRPIAVVIQNAEGEALTRHALSSDRLFSVFENRSSDSAK